MTAPTGPDGAEPAGAGNRVIDAGTDAVTTWAELEEVPLAPPTAAVVPGSRAALPWVWAHARTGDELLVAAASRMSDDLAADLAAGGFRLTGERQQEPTSPREPEPDRLWLLTSGSTGRPKRIGHSLASLTTVGAAQQPRTWLCPYLPGTYAWWQVVTLGLAQPGQDLLLVGPDELDTWTEAAARHGVTAASGTPTFWRQTLMAQRDTLAQVPLAQVTLGGEPVDQAVIDRLHEALPGTRVSWIYASSEVGASIVVHDGQAGFPEEWLGREVPGRPVIDVDGDELVITSPHHGAGLAGAVRTGDRVERREGRVLITGRLDRDEINVGGTKVSAGVVREVLTAHPEVAWAQVSARQSPLVGQLVQTEVVPHDPGRVTDADGRAALERELVAWCGPRLPEVGVPRRFRFLDQIPVKESLKSDV